jgi:hypothetical protein
MRINKLQLAGLAAVLVGASANGASAEPLVITGATTTPVETSDPVAGGLVEAGNVTVNTGGSITVGAGQTAVTLDSNNTVTNNGVISSLNANNTTGILVTGGVTGTITNTASITLTEDYTLTDTNADGDLDGGFASPASTGRFGIWVDSGGFTGNITNANINIEGNNSGGIRIDGLMTGDLVSTGLMSVYGDNSHGFLIQGGGASGIDGDVRLSGTINIFGTNSTGLTLNAPIINGGELSINGTWTVTGYHSTLRPLDVSNLDPDDLMQSGSAIAVHYSVAGGITIEGIGVENDPDDDGDAVTEATDTDDNNTANVRVYGSAPAVWIAADPSADIVLGPTSAAGYGFHNRGQITAEGVYDGVISTALRIEGLGGSSVFTGNGIINDNTITSFAREADAYGVIFGQNADVPTLLNRQNIAGTTTSETAQTAYAVYIGAGANVQTIENSGLLRAQVFGEASDAVAVIDASGTLTTINNTGEISALIIPTDSDLTDDIVPVATGDRIAIDVSAALSSVTITQSATVPFTDDDAVDNDVNARPEPLINGDIRLGGFADTISLGAGSIIGDIEFDAGADIFNITNGAVYRGIISDSGGDLTLNITDGTLDLQGGQVNISAATFGADSVLGVVLSQTPANSTLVTASGQITFVAGAEILPVVPVGLPTSDTITFLVATGGFVDAANVLGVISGPGTSFLYNQEIVLAAPTEMALDFILKTPAELGLNNNQGIAFNPILDALRLNVDAATALAAIDNEFDFFDAYEDLMPSFSSSATELAATAIQQMQSATTNRLSATRLHDLDEVSVWAQEIAYGLNREPATFQGQEFRGHGFGLATGIDGPLANGGLFGLSASFITSEVEEPGRPEGEISATFGQVNAYYGTAVGAFDLDFVGGVGAGQMSSRRFVEIGDSFSALSEADWWAFEGHGAIRASLPMHMGDLITINPQSALTYVAMSEQGYTEDGGGTSIDYDVDDSFSQRLWADVGVEFSALLRMRGEAVVAPRLYAGYRANLIDEEAERTFRFVSGGSDFTLTDESLGDGGAIFGIGIDATNGYSTFTLGYEGEFGDQVERHSLNASIRFRF